MLLAISTLFVLADGGLSLAFLAASLFANYAAAEGIRRMAPGSTGRRLALAAVIILNLAPLLFYKSGSHGLWSLDAARHGIPLGLAFYTLQQITYQIHLQRPDAETLGFVRYAAWGSFFAQLPAGPISNYGRMAPQYRRLGLDVPATAQVARGLTLVLAGVVKKTWIADPLARMVDALLAGGGALTPLEAWAAAFGYLLQLYFDFSAYSDIAIGIGLCFGLSLPLNFDSPLKSTTPGQYVMRWHVSLMTFVREYVFEPMFKAARRLPLRPTGLRYGVAWAIATAAAYLAVGAWHSLSPVTLVQGLVIALALIVLQFGRQAARASVAPRSRAERVIRRVLGHAVLLALVSVFALFLRTAGGGQLSTVLAALVDVKGAGQFAGESLAYFAGITGMTADASAPSLFPNAAIGARAGLGLMAAALAIALAAPNTMQMFGIAGTSRPSSRLRWRPSMVGGCITGCLLFLAVAGVTRSAPAHGFIYAQF